MRGAFGSNFAWQTRDLVNFDDVLKGSKAPFCETVVVFGHDDDSVWRVPHLSDASGSFFVTS